MAGNNFLVKLLSLQIRNRQWPHGPLVPTSRQIAAQMGCSGKTAQKALRRLCELGLITRVTGSRRYTVAGTLAGAIDTADRPDAAAMTYASRFDRLLAAVRKYFVSGGVAPGERVPSLRSLSARFGSSPASMRRVLAGLCAEGVLVHERGALVLTLNRQSVRGSARWVLCTNEMTLNSFREAFQRVEQALGRFCRDHQWPEHLLRIEPDTGEIGAAVSERTAGYVFVGSDRGYRWKRFFEAQADVPLVYLATEQLVKTHSFVREAPCIALLPDGHRAGREVGAALAEAGVGEVVFLSHVPVETAWAASRYDGLREGIGNGVEAVVPPQEPVSRTLPPGAGGGPATAVLRSGIFPDYIARSFVSPVYAAAHVLQIHRSWSDRFGELATKGYGAWVCANDHLAAAATLYLRAQPATLRAHPPRVIGFDNSLISRVLGFSSYDFSWDRALVTSMDRLLVSPPDPRRVSNGAIPGEVLMRGGTPGQ